jgi:hypothetical protein
VVLTARCRPVTPLHDFRCLRVSLTARLKAVSSLQTSIRNRKPKTVDRNSSHENCHGTALHSRFPFSGNGIQPSTIEHISRKQNLPFWVFDLDGHRALWKIFSKVSLLNIPRGDRPWGITSLMVLLRNRPWGLFPCGSKRQLSLLCFSPRNYWKIIFKDLLTNP